MDSEKLAQIVAKIRKLQALAGSANVHEAALAAERMHELLLRYNLSLDLIGEATSADAYEGRGVILENADEWRRLLINVVATHCYCRAFGAGGNGRRIYVVGTAADLHVAGALFRFLAAELERLAALERLTYEQGLAVAQRLALPSWRESFFHGAVAAIHDRLEERRAYLERTEPQCEALAIRKDARLNRAVERLVGSPKDAAPAAAEPDLWAYFAGHRAGEGLPLGPMVPQETSTTDQPARRDGENMRLPE
ncbi:MAG: DUF2786 domain-containing protein [Candidatus Schekmanbacteria bacterium]|nr:DUF2786 domain-containing protein [Candidatus Schekmanbacteria bacterium]